MSNYLNIETLVNLRRAMTQLGMATEDCTEAFGARLEPNLLDMCRFIDNLAGRFQLDHVIRLEKETQAKSALITEQLALAEERNTQIQELITELEAVRDLARTLAKDNATMRGLLEIDTPIDPAQNPLLS